MTFLEKSNPDHMKHVEYQTACNRWFGFSLIVLGTIASYVSGGIFGVVKSYLIAGQIFILGFLVLTVGLHALLGIAEVFKWMSSGRKIL